MATSNQSKYEKVNVEILDDQGNVVDTSHPAVKKFRKIKNKIAEKTSLYWKRTKLTIAILLDIIDFFIAWIPLVNSAYSIFCFIVLLVILKNKKIAFLSLIEAPLIIPPFSFIAMLLPICTFCVIIDNSINGINNTKPRNSGNNFNGIGKNFGKHFSSGKVFEKRHYYR